MRRTLRPKRQSVRKVARDKQRRARKDQLSEAADKLLVELGSGKTVSEGIVSVFEVDSDPIAHTEEGQ